MSDIAQLGIAVDTGPVVGATRALDQLATQAASTAAAVNTLQNTTKTATTAAAAATTATTAQTTALKQQAAAATQAGAAQAQAATAAAQATRTATAAHQTFGAAMQQTAVNANRASQAVGLAGYQMRNLGFQVNDIATGLLTGQSPFMIMAQQGGQVLQILQSGQGGVVGALKGIGSSLAGMVTIGRLAAGALASVAIGGVASYVSWENQIRSLSRSLQGLGRQSGLTVSDLQRMGTRGAAASGLSTSEGLGLAGQMAASGQIGGTVMQGIIEQTKAFARITGQDIPDAGAALAKAFSDPAKGAKTLDDAMGFLDDRTLKLIEHMARSGDTAGAQGVLLSKLRGEIARTTDDTWSLAKAWDGVTNAASNAAGAIGRAISGPTDQQRLDSLKREAERERQIRQSQLSTVAPSGHFVAGPIRPFDGASQADDLPAARALQAFQGNQQRQFLARGRVAFEAAQTQASKRAGASISAQLPDIESLKSIEDEYKTLDAILKQPGGLEKLGTTAKEAQDALDALGRQRDTYLTQAQSQAQADALAIKSIEARTVAEKAAVAVEQTRASLAGKRGVTPAQEAAQEAAAAQRVIAESTMQSLDQLRQAETSTATAGMMPYAKALEDINLKYARQIELANGNAEAIANIQKIRQLDLDALQKETVAGAVDEQQPQIKAVQRLHDEYRSLDEFLKKPGGLEKLGFTADQATQSLAALARQLATTQTAAQAQAASDALAIQAINARTVAEKAAVAAAQIRQGLAGKAGFTEADATAAEAAARQRVIAESAAQSRDQLRQLQDTTATAGMLPYAKALEDINIKYARQIELADGNAEAIKNLATMRNLEISALQKESIVKPIEDANRTTNEQIAALKIQQETFGATTQVIAQAAAKQQLLNKYNADGVPITNALSQAIEQQASQAGKAAQAAADLQYRQGLIIETMDAVRSGAGGFLSSFTDGLLSGKKASDALRDSLKGLLRDITQRLESSFVDQLFGKMGTAGGDHPGLLGGWLKGVVESFTGKSSDISLPSPIAPALATANITAGIVNVMGGGGIGAFAGSQAEGSTVSTAIAKLFRIGPNGEASPYANGGGSGASFNAPSLALPGGGDVQSQIWGYFKSKGLTDIQAAGMMGNIGAESGFKPSVINSIGATGLFQMLSPNRKAGLLNAVGGKQGLGNVGGQLDYAWKEMQGPEGRSFSMLKGATSLRGATAAGAAFERPEGFSWGNPSGVNDFGKRMEYAEAALKKFGGSTTDVGKAATDAAGSMRGIEAPVQDVAKNLGGLGAGAAQTAPALGQAADGMQKLSETLQGGTGASSNGLLGWISKLGSGFGSSGTGFDWNFDTSGFASGFAGGGYTGAGHYLRPAGVVHKGEVVWSQRDVASAGGVGVVEAMRLGMRGYARGGSPDRIAAPRMPSRGADDRGGKGTNITIVNQAAGDGYTTRQRQSTSGSMDDVVIEIVKKAHTRGDMDKPMAMRHGLSPTATRR